MINNIERIKDLIFPEWTYIYEVYKYKYSNDYIVSCFRFNKKGKVQEMILVKSLIEIGGFMNSIQILVHLLNDSAKLPTKANDSDAGWDIYSPIDIVIKKHSFAVIDSYITIIPKIDMNSDFNIYGQIKGRSGLSLLHNIEVCNAGVIDQDYRGTIKVKLYNTGDTDYIVKKGDRICQIIFYLIPKIKIDLVESQKDDILELLNTTRGVNGIGSSGK